MANPNLTSLHNVPMITRDTPTWFLFDHPSHTAFHNSHDTKLPPPQKKDHFKTKALQQAQTNRPIDDCNAPCSAGAINEATSLVTAMHVLTNQRQQTSLPLSTYLICATCGTSFSWVRACMTVLVLLSTPTNTKLNFLLTPTNMKHDKNAHF